MLNGSSYIYEVRDHGGKVLMTFVTKEDAQKYANSMSGTVYPKATRL